jgi:Lon protease-like protein
LDSVEQAPTETMINVAAQICPFDAAAKQALLEAVSFEERAQALWRCSNGINAADDPNKRPLQ